MFPTWVPCVLTINVKHFRVSVSKNVVLSLVGLVPERQEKNQSFLLFCRYFFFFQKDLNCFDERGDRNRQGACLEQLLPVISGHQDI